MIRKHTLAALALMAVSGLAWAGSGAVTFQNLDANRDGKITLDEAQKAPEVKARFAEADANKDGVLDAAEFAAVEIMPKKQPKQPR